MTDTVLITGGLGYVGGRVVSTLADYSQYNLRITSQRDQRNLPGWLKKGSIIKFDICSEQNLDQLCQGVKYIIHFAALNEIDSAKDPQKALLVNTLGTLKLLQAAERAGVERFIYFSTAHIYGAPLVGTISEQSVAKPVHPYAITHYAAEHFVLASNHYQKLQGIVLRLSNGIGSPTDPNVNRWTLISNDLCRQAVTAGKLTLRSSGMQQRDFITLHDVGKAVVHFLQLSPILLEDGLFNLGGKTSMRVIDLARHIADRCYTVLGFEPKIEYPEPQEGEVSKNLDYRINKLESTGFTLSGNIDDEIDATLRLCQKAFGG